jgi:hypothetical protein
MSRQSIRKTDSVHQFIDVASEAPVEGLSNKDSEDNLCTWAQSCQDDSMGLEYFILTRTIDELPIAVKNRVDADVKQANGFAITVSIASVGQFSALKG